MLTLYLMRHAKSDWPEGVSDMNRDLSSKGMKAASVMGTYMRNEEMLPDFVLVSPAQRTQETWGLMAPLLREPDMELEPRLYGASAGQIFEIIQKVAKKTETLMIVAHNPGVQDFALKAAKGSDPEDWHRISIKYPTAGLAVLEFPYSNWEEVTWNSGMLKRFITPKMLSEN